MKRYHSTVVVCDCRLQKIVGNLYVTFPSGGAQLIFALDFRDFCHLLSAKLGPSSSHNGVNEILKSMGNTVFQTLNWLLSNWTYFTKKWLLHAVWSYKGQSYRLHSTKLKSFGLS